MLIVDGEFNFTEAEASGFCKWYLRQTVGDVTDEFTTEEERQKFLLQRERRLQIQLDELLHLTFDHPIVCEVDKKPYMKIVKASHAKPLSSVGSTIANSRFNYKNLQPLATRSIYFGQDKFCCYAEKFHLDIQRRNYAQLVQRTVEEQQYEFVFEPHEFHEYAVHLDKVLVLTSEASYKAIGIPDRVVKDEWFSVNDDFEIPTAGQILGRVAANSGYQGILYTSVRTQTTNNLVVFEENTGPLQFKLLNKIALDPTTFESPS